MAVPALMATFSSQCSSTMRLKRFSASSKWW
jgi:hypothetical protein